MILRYFGHSFFTIDLENGIRIATDPYYEFYGYPQRKLMADIALISHHHFDHDGIASFTNSPIVIDSEGSHSPAAGIKVKSISTWHDSEGGRLRGANLIHIIEAEGLRIVHCGDLGHLLSAEQIRAIGHADLLLVPVGGYYTISAEEARVVCAQLQPEVVIPMHYQTKYNPEMNIADLNVWLKVSGSADPQMPLCRFTNQDICEFSPLITMAVAEA